MALSAAVAGAFAACGAANVRPYLVPFPEALVDTVPGEAERAVSLLVGLLEVRGIPVVVASPEEGYIESRWHETGVDSTAPHLGSRVRFRFWVDPIGLGRAQVVGEAVGEHTLDPSLPPRERESMVPPAHPGHQLLRAVIAALKERFAP